MQLVDYCRAFSIWFLELNIFILPSALTGLCGVSNCFYFVSTANVQLWRLKFLNFIHDNFLNSPDNSDFKYEYGSKLLHFNVAHAVQRKFKTTFLPYLYTIFELPFPSIFVLFAPARVRSSSSTILTDSILRFSRSLYVVLGVDGWSVVSRAFSLTVSVFYL